MERRRGERLGKYWTMLASSANSWRSALTTARNSLFDGDPRDVAVKLCLITGHCSLLGVLVAGFVQFVSARLAGGVFQLSLYSFVGASLGAAISTGTIIYREHSKLVHWAGTWIVLPLSTIAAHRWITENTMVEGVELPFAMGAVAAFFWIPFALFLVSIASLILVGWNSLRELAVRIVGPRFFRSLAKIVGGRACEPERPRLLVSFTGLAALGFLFLSFFLLSVLSTLPEHRILAGAVVVSEMATNNGRCSTMPRHTQLKMLDAETALLVRSHDGRLEFQKRSCKP